MKLPAQIGLRIRQFRGEGNLSLSLFFESGWHLLHASTSRITETVGQRGKAHVVQLLGIFHVILAVIKAADE